MYIKSTIEIIIVLTPEFVHKKTSKYTKIIAPNSSKIETFSLFSYGFSMMNLKTTNTSSTIKIGAIILKSSKANGRMIAIKTLLAMYRPPIGLKMILPIVYPQIKMKKMIAQARLPL
jgi:hypothetical protein